MSYWQVITWMLRIVDTAQVRENPKQILTLEEGEIWPLIKAALFHSWRTFIDWVESGGSCDVFQHERLYSSGYKSAGASAFGVVVLLFHFPPLPWVPLPLQLILFPSLSLSFSLSLSLSLSLSISLSLSVHFKIFSLSFYNWFQPKSDVSELHGLFNLCKNRPS